MSRNELMERLMDDFGYEMSDLVDKTTDYLDNLYRFLSEEAAYEGG